MGTLSSLAMPIAMGWQLEGHLCPELPGLWSSARLLCPSHLLWFPEPVPHHRLLSHCHSLTGSPTPLSRACGWGLRGQEGTCGAPGSRGLNSHLTWATPDPGADQAWGPPNPSAALVLPRGLPARSIPCPLSLCPMLYADVPDRRLVHPAPPCCFLPV